MSGFRVYWRGEWPKKKRIFHDGEFESRQQARQWCRNQGTGREDLTIVHPDGTEESVMKVEPRIAQIADRIAVKMTAATKNLKELMDMAPEWYRKREQFLKEQEEALQEFNRKWGEAHAELEQGTTELVTTIRDELVKYFEKSGKGVRRADLSGGLVEVFIGSKDGVQREQSKVSVHVDLTFEKSTRATVRFRPENLADVEVQLAPANTVPKLIQWVKKNDENGFWDEGGEERTAAWQPTTADDVKYLTILIPAGQIFHQTDFDVSQLDDEAGAISRRYGGSQLYSRMNKGRWEIVLQFPDAVEPDKMRVLREIRQLDEWFLPSRYGATMEWSDR